MKNGNAQLLNCPQCGADLSESSPGTPCSACLLQLGLQTWNKSTGLHGLQAEDSVYDEGQSIEKLANQFPQLEIVHLVGRGGMGGRLLRSPEKP